MNELLIKQATMSSNEIAALTNKNHSHVLRDIKSMVSSLYELSIDDPFMDHELNHKVILQKDYRGYISSISLDMEHSLCLTAGYSVKQRMAIIKRWKELENNQNNVSLLPDFTNPVEAARAWADEKEKTIQYQTLIEQQKPAVEFVEKYVNAEGNMTFRQVAKILDIKEPAFKLFLIEHGIIYYTNKTMTPYQKHIDAGRFIVKTGVNDFSEHAYSQMKFTPKGVEWVARLWNDKDLEVVA